MKAASLAHTFLTFFLLFTTVSASWNWSSLFARNALDRRQNNNNDETSATATPSRTTAASNSRSGTASATNSDDASETGSASASGTGTRSGNSTATTSKPKSTLVDPRLPAGGVSLMEPAITSGAQYYRVGQSVTFEWNYTSLVNTPSFIDVFATCNLNQATYTIAANMSVQETGRVVWDTGNQDNITAAFPVATYTLVIHDAAKDPTQVAAAGDLGAFNQFRFGMYTGQPYTPLNEFKCSTCNAGASLSPFERQALSVLGVTAAVTVLSFTWFANGAGLFA